MKRKWNVTSFLVVAVLLMASHLGSAQSLQSTPTVQDQEPFAEINQRLNEAADAKLANAFPSSPTTGLDDRKMKKGLFIGLLAIPTHATQSLARLDLLRPIIESELVRAGLPVELSGMVQVESGAQTFALSPRGARGLWQLMPDTARRYGLTVSAQRDERLDTYKSTQAAAQYLRALYAQFGDWSLVFAAYNAGEQTIQRAIDRSGTTNFLQLKGRLPTETRRYVPAVGHRSHNSGTAKPRLAWGTSQRIDRPRASSTRKPAQLSPWDIQWKQDRLLGLEALTFPTCTRVLSCATSASWQSPTRN